ncbi:MAG: tRNA(Ile)-lysidine synthase [Lentisphaerae bacterium ADurb.Bin242]|nr:MAG: tRNA(Ile)-lysidine synthase [Lentisphaerae bacterium ADurb.Bin242]
MNGDIHPPAAVLSLLPGKKVFCSFSGGADSLALLLFLTELRAESFFPLEAVHFEHGFRGADSLRDAEFCRNFCVEHEIPFLLFHIDAPGKRQKGEGDEEAARRLRLEYWQKIVFNPENSLVALGHHADDRIENVLLRLFRGSNASGLSSMRAVQKLGRIVFIRPFIGISRQEIEAFLRARGIEQWCHDATNRSCVYRRNFLRHELLPSIKKEFPFALAGIRQSVRALETDASCLEETARNEFASLRRDSTAERWLALHPAIRTRVLRHFIQAATGENFVPDSKLIARFSRALESPSPGGLNRVPLRGYPAWELRIANGKVFMLNLEKNDRSAAVRWKPETEEAVEAGNLLFRSEILPPEQVYYTTDKSSAYFDADKMNYPLVISLWRHAEHMVPFGKTSPVGLKKIFSDAGISSVERDRYPVVRLPDGTPVWIPFVRNSAFASVTPETQRVLRLFALQEHLKHQR